MHRPLQLVAVTLWVVSFFLPTLPVPSGGYKFGYELFLSAAAAALFIPFSLFFPGHLLSFASNLLFFRECFYVVLPGVERPRLPSPRVLGLALPLNLFMGLATLGATKSNISFINGVLQLPGFYVWVCAFLFLLLARLAGDPAKPAAKWVDSNDPTPLPDQRP